MINIQPIEKHLVSDGSTLEIVDVFYTIQGEGPFAGQPAVFIRLAGCNLQCPGCDTEYTQGREQNSIEQILRAVDRVLEGQRHSTEENPLVVITGGEPFRQNLTQLLQELTNEGFRVQVETNGSLPLPAMHPDTSMAVTIVCSPKTGKIHPSVYNFAECFKYVLAADSVAVDDGLPILALDHTASPRVARPRPGAPVYLQPMDSGNDILNALNTKAAVRSCMMYGYTLQLQIHKILGMQ
jgi:7-carboxy-7-deazaguanine synthase